MAEVINVSSKSSTKTLSELLLQSFEAQKVAALKAIGAGAVNQAVKAIAVASLQVSVKVNISFFTVTIDGQEKSGIKFEVREDNNGKI